MPQTTIDIFNDLRQSRSLHVRFSPEATRAIREERNVSKYVSRALEDRHQEWMSALFHLRSLGWSMAQVRIAVDALLLTILVPSESVTVAVASALERATDRPNGDLVQRWVQPVRASEPMARALWALRREHAADSRGLARALATFRTKAR